MVLYYKYASLHLKRVFTKRGSKCLAIIFIN